MATSARSVLVYLLTAVILAGVGVGIFTWRLRATRDRVGEEELPPELVGVLVFPPFSFDVGRLEEQWEEQRSAVSSFMLQQPEEEVIEAVHEFNVAVASGALSYEQVHALSDDLSATVSHYIAVRGPDAYRELGWHLFEQFATALQEIRNRPARLGTGVGTGLEEPFQESISILENIGNFLEIAHETGLDNGSGRLPIEPGLLAVIFRYRWFSFAEDYANLSPMTPYEREVFWRWRIESARGFSLEERLAMVDRAESIYREMGMDPDQVRGILAFTSGRPELARGYIRRALRNHPDSSALAEALEWLERTGLNPR